MTRSFAERAVQIAPNDAAIQAIIADAYLLAGDPDMARRLIKKAIKLNPNDYLVMVFAGVVLPYVGDIDESLKWIEKLIRHDPLSADAFREPYFESYYLARRYEDAIDSIKGWRDPPTHMLAQIAAAYAQLDRMDEAQEVRRHYESLLPQGYSFNDCLTAHLRMCAHQKDRDNWIEGYRKAGFEV